MLNTLPSKNYINPNDKIKMLVDNSLVFFELENAKETGTFLGLKTYNELFIKAKSKFYIPFTHYLKSLRDILSILESKEGIKFLSIIHQNIIRASRK